MIQMYLYPAKTFIIPSTPLSENNGKFEMFLKFPNVAAL